MKHISTWDFSSIGFKYARTYRKIPATIQLIKVNDGNTRAKCGICSKPTINERDQRYKSCPGIFIVNFEQISYTVMVFPLLTLNKQMLVR